MNAEPIASPLPPMERNWFPVETTAESRFGTFPNSMRSTATSNRLRVIGPIGQAAWGLACSPTANLVASGGKVPGHKIFVWDLDSDAEPIELIGHTNNVTSLRFSEDGMILASTSQDGSAKLWDIAAGRGTAGATEPTARARR